MINLIGSGGHAKVIKDMLTFVQGEGWIVAIGDNRDRKKEAELLEGHVFARLFHPVSTIALSAEIGLGTVVMAGAVIQADVTIGKHCIINTLAGIDHDCVIGDYVHIAPGCVLCGDVTVGEGAFIGAGSVAVPGAVVEPWAFYKAGSLIK